MAQDYKSRANTRKPKQKPNSPLIPFLAGMMLGMFLVALAWLKLGAGFPGIDRGMATQSPPQPAPGKPQREKKEEPRPRFDFYTILPEMEVIIPGEEIASPVPDKPAPTGSMTKPATIDSDGSYMLQMGSFRRRTDAERLRAQLALIGIEAKIQQVNTGDNQTFHRVRSGPYTSRKKINEIRALARRNKIDSLVLRLKQ